MDHILRDCTKAGIRTRSDRKHIEVHLIEQSDKIIKTLLDDFPRVINTNIAVQAKRIYVILDVESAHSLHTKEYRPHLKLCHGSVCLFDL